MTKSSKVNTVPDAPFPVPKWAKATAFIGFLALIFAGTNQLEQSVIALLELSEIDGSSLESLGIMAATVFVITAQPYSSLMARNEAIYVTACTLINIILAFGAATATLIAIDSMAPDMFETTLGSAVPLIAGGIAMVVGVLVTHLATRRRERMAMAASATAEIGDVE